MRFLSGRSLKNWNQGRPSPLGRSSHFLAAGLLVAFAGVGSSCSSSATLTSGRSPAAEALFQKALKQKTKREQARLDVLESQWKGSIQEKLNQGVRSWLQADLLAEELKDQFDEALKTQRSMNEIFSDTPYQQLLQLRAIQDQLVDDVALLAREVPDELDFVIRTVFDPQSAASTQTPGLREQLSLEKLKGRLAQRLRMSEGNATSSLTETALELLSLWKRSKKRLQKDTWKKWAQPGDAVPFSLLPNTTVPSVVPSPAPVTPLSGRIEPSAEPRGNLQGDEFPQGTWALTFDDGPDAQNTDRMLQLLNSYGVSGTFFLLSEKFDPVEVGSRAARNNARLATQTAALHGVGSHSFSHARLTETPLENWEREISGAALGLQAVLGPGSYPQFFRLPYGAGKNDPAIREAIAAAKMVHVFWNVDTLDWQDPDPESVSLRALAQIQKHQRAGRGGIILFHDTHASSIDATRLVLENYLLNSRNRIRLVTIPEAVSELNRSRAPSPPVAPAVPDAPPVPTARRGASCYSEYLRQKVKHCGGTDSICFDGQWFARSSVPEFVRIECGL